MFGWGMLEDGHGKQQRREQWNHAIDQAKAELEDQKKAVEQRMRYLGQDEKERLLNDLDENADSIQEEYDEGPQTAEDVAQLPTSSEVINEWKQHAAKARDLLGKSEAGEHSVPEDGEPKADSEESDAAQQKRWEKAAIGRWMSEQERELWKDTTIYTMLSRQKSTMEHNTAADLDVENVPPQSIYAPESTKRAGLRSRWTRRKIQATNLAMAKLVLRLIKEGVRKGDKGVEYSVREKRRRLQNLPVYFHQLFWPGIAQLGRIELLITHQWYDTIVPPRDMQEDIPTFPPVFHNQYPYYSQDPHGQFHLDCYRMNHHIFNCFEQCFSGEISLQTLIMNICDSLMTSSAPPNITTYNALILGFTRLEQSTLVDFVIQALEETYIRPDEITSCAILNHYMRTDRANHFSNYVNMMTGSTYVANRRYLHLAHPLLHHNWHNQRVTRKTHNRVVPHPTQEGKLVQKVFPTPKVFSRIIVGTLKFHGLEHAIKLCTQLTRDGWAFDITGLTYFLAATAAEADWAAGVMVWQQIQDLRATAPPASPPKTPHEAANPPLPPLDIEPYAHMLVLCDRCGRPDVAEHVVAEAYATSGLRPVPIQRLAARLAKGGRDAMLMKSLRADDHRLRADMGQQLAGDLRTWRAEEDERRAEEEWLVAHAANASDGGGGGGGGGGVVNWWEQESLLQDDAGAAVEATKTSPTTAIKAKMATSTLTSSTSPAPSPLNQTTLPPHAVFPDHQHPTAAKTATHFSATAAADDVDTDEAVKAWEAEAWMSTKSRRLYTHVRKAWSPQWEGQEEDGGKVKKHGPATSRGKENNSADGGDGGGGGGRR
ncbi:hypothetical protein IWX90DRAFT_486821 [Phyllosticta citrichinensis]|uniref:Uncharacterized protein n=1 Tax=Phyllosticta citrichinensis TaxID=1130410 RepID=A0ABR1XUR1_9PEZI